jgi:hypothetical protein
VRGDRRRPGSGSGTSESIDAGLSNGEHVITAREVIRFRGHDVLQAMRRETRRG